MDDETKKDENEVKEGGEEVTATPEGEEVTPEVTPEGEATPTE